MMMTMMMIVTLDGNKGNDDDDDDDESIAETGRQLSPGYNYPCLGSHAIAAGVRDDHDEDVPPTRGQGRHPQREKPPQTTWLPVCDRDSTTRELFTSI